MSSCSAVQGAPSQAVGPSSKHYDVKYLDNIMDGLKIGMGESEAFKLKGDFGAIVNTIDKMTFYERKPEYTINGYKAMFSYAFRGGTLVRVIMSIDPGKSNVKAMLSSIKNSLTYVIGDPFEEDSGFGNAMWHTDLAGKSAIVYLSPGALYSDRGLGLLKASLSAAEDSAESDPGLITVTIADLENPNM